MPPIAPPNVLILAQNPPAGVQWVRWLEGAAQSVWLAPSEVPAGATIEILITDFASLASAVETAAPALGGGEAGGRLPSTVGVIAIGTADWADVNLPPDAAPREMRLACALVAKVVRLRAQLAGLAQTQEENIRLACTDSLTGLPNRRAWEVQLPLRHRRAQSAKQDLWLAIIDLDGFKAVNEACGLSAGDELLARVAQAMASALGPDDLIARLGGDEFGVLLEGMDEASARAALDRVRAAVAGQAAPPGVARLSASIGYAQAKTADAVHDDLFAAAERALREAKRAGGNRALRGDAAQI